MTFSTISAKLIALRSLHHQRPLLRRESSYGNRGAERGGSCIGTILGLVAFYFLSGMNIPSREPIRSVTCLQVGRHSRASPIKTASGLMNDMQMPPHYDHVQ